MSVQPFTHLHLHTEYSLLDGANKISNLVSRIKELGITVKMRHGMSYKKGDVLFVNFPFTDLSSFMKHIKGVRNCQHC